MPNDASLCTSFCKYFSGLRARACSFAGIADADSTVYGFARTHRIVSPTISHQQNAFSFASANPYVLYKSPRRLLALGSCETRSSIQIRICIFASQGPFIPGAFVFCFNSTSNQRKVYMCSRPFYQQSVLLVATRRYSLQGNESVGVNEQARYFCVCSFCFCTAKNICSVHAWSMAALIFINI
jgi:hypothetical protein